MMEAVRLDDGRTCAIEPLVIHDNAVVYGEAAEAHARTGGNAVSEEVVPVVEEKVAVGKRVADHGRDIRGSSHVVQDRVNEDVPRSLSRGARSIATSPLRMPTP